MSDKREQGKTICLECGYQGPLRNYKQAPNPFDPGDTIYGCPACKSVDRFVMACESPGCWNRVVCGSPSPAGYMHTCSEHRPTENLIARGN